MLSKDRHDFRSLEQHRYVGLVRQIFEYESVILLLHYVMYINEIETV